MTVIKIPCLATEIPAILKCPRCGFENETGKQIEAAGRLFGVDDKNKIVSWACAACGSEFSIEVTEESFDAR